MISALTGLPRLDYITASARETLDGMEDVFRRAYHAVYEARNSRRSAGDA